MQLKALIAGIFRAIIYPIVSFPLTYYAGMVLVRVSRKIRGKFYRPDSGEVLKKARFTGNLTMIVDVNSYMGGSIYWTGFHHLNEILYLRRYLSAKMIFVDIGANQGEFSIFAAARLTQGKVLAFEPVMKNRKMLIQNQRLNNLKNLEIYDFGLSDKAEILPIYTSTDTIIHQGLHEGLSSLYKTDTRNFMEEMVSLKVFDEIFYSKLERLDIIKIDVEGAELFVLRGMQKSLKEFTPDLLIEINEPMFEAAGYTTGELITFLKELNYTAFKIKKGKLKPIEISDLQIWGNYIFKVAS